MDTVNYTKGIKVLSYLYKRDISLLKWQCVLEFSLSCVFITRRGMSFLKINTLFAQIRSFIKQYVIVKFSVLSDSLWPHGL